MACLNICNSNSIKIKTGVTGHLYPYIDTSVCTDCGLCHKICPENTPLSRSAGSYAYAGWHKDPDNYKTSASGGAAAALSELIISRGGAVYGCVEEKGKIKHIRISDSKELHRFKGSKYVQSEIKEIYKPLLKDLREGRQVLFTGTPCQAAGLRSYLRKDYANLYIADLICHGVPSQKDLNDHIQQKCGTTDVDSIKFREGNTFCLSVKKGEQTLYRSLLWEERYSDSFFNAFIDGYNYRESCYHCRYACPDRVSDITIGDFWGLGDDIKADNKNGCSCIIPVTEKGKELLENIEDRFILHRRDIEEAIKGNDQLRAPMVMNRRIKIFRAIYPILGQSLSYKLLNADRIIKLRTKKSIKRL